MTIKKGDRVYAARLFCGAVQVGSATVTAIGKGNVATLDRRLAETGHLLRVEAGHLRQTEQEALSLLLYRQRSDVTRAEMLLEQKRADLRAVVAALGQAVAEGRP